MKGKSKEIFRGNNYDIKDCVGKIISRVQKGVTNCDQTNFSKKVKKIILLPQLKPSMDFRTLHFCKGMFF